MRALKVFDLLKKRVLVTRQSARAIEAELGRALAEGQGELVLDFSGVEGITPSFLDETLSVIEEFFQRMNGGEFRVKIENPPTQLSSKFAAVGRGHGLDIRESDGKAWIIFKSRS